MGTNKCTTITLYTACRIPLWYHYGCTTFLVCGSTEFELSVCNIFECRYRKAVTIHNRDWLEKVFHHLNNLWTSCKFFCRSICFRISPRSRNFYFMNCIYTSIDCFVVHFYDCITLLRVGFLSSCFHVLDSFIDWHDVCKFEECGLKNCVSTFTHTNFNCFVDCIDCIQLDIIVSDVFLGSSWHMFVKLFICPLAVDHEDSARFYILNHLVSFYYIRWVVASHEVCLVDVVRALDRFVTKTKMGNCNTTCLLGVILEVCLDVFVCVVTDDLCRVLVRTYCTVSTKTPELTFYSTFCRCDRSWFYFRKTEVCNIIYDTDCKTRFWSIFLQLFVNSKYR